VLFDGQRRRSDIDLLDDAWLGRVEPQAAAAAGAGVERVGVTCSGGKGWRMCRSWPGCPQMERFLPSDRSGGFGLTMSEEGGFDDVSEFFLAAANWARTRSSSASTAATLASSTWHWEHVSDDVFIVEM
jgi:hypothetical protein